MKNLLILLSAMSFYACSNKLVPGNYVYKNYGHILIDKDLNYKYQNFNHFYSAASSGKIAQKNDTLFFIADSSYYFTINIFDLSNTGQHPGQKRIVLKSDSKNQKNLNDFLFYFKNNQSNVFYFDSNDEITVPDSVLDKDFLLFSKISPNSQVVPTPINDLVLSNILRVSDNFGSWNTMTLTVHINYNVFCFRKLQNMIVDRGNLKAIEFPVYKLKK